MKCTPLLLQNIIFKLQENDGTTTYTLKQGSDHAQLSEELWRFFTGIYGGGPEVKLKSPNTQTVVTSETTFDNRKPYRKYSESDREDYCTKSTSEMNLRDVHCELQKNQSLQNINRRYKTSRNSAESDEDVTYRTFQYKKHEPNGNYQDSDEDMDNHGNTIRIENGIDSSDHDTNDNPICRKVDRLTDSELPNLDSISLKNKPKTGKVRKPRRRNVK